MIEGLQRFARNTSRVSTVGVVASLVGFFVAEESISRAHPELSKEGADFWGYIRSHEDFSHAWGAEEFAEVLAGAFWGLFTVAVATFILGNVGRRTGRYT